MVNERSGKVYLMSRLRYHHSAILQEVLNIGILLYFPDDRKMMFIYPKSLKRINRCYKDVQVKTLRMYLNHFRYLADKLTCSMADDKMFIPPVDAREFKSSIGAFFMPQDDSALQFSDVGKGLMLHFTPEKIADDTYDRYFGKVKV